MRTTGYLDIRVIQTRRQVAIETLILEPVRIPKYECILIMMGLVLFPPVQMQITGRIDRTTVHPHSDVGHLLAVTFDASSLSATASSHIFSQN